MIRLYTEISLSENKEVFLNENQSHYVQHVMRLKKRDYVLLFNGQDGEWKAQILEHSKKTTKLFLFSQTRGPTQEGNLWLLFSPLKPKRQAFLIEKATEVGVSSLWPIRFERTSIPHVNSEKMCAQAIEAAEQCERLTLPEIKPLTKLSALLAEWPQNRTLLFGNETLSSPLLSAISVNSQKKFAFLVGPEGGFTPQELTQLKSHPQAQGVTLNPHILRAETAALVGISYLQLMLMDRKI